MEGPLWSNQPSFVCLQEKFLEMVGETMEPPEQVFLFADESELPQAEAPLTNQQQKHHI